MSESEPTVFIVDDDSAVLKGLRLLVKSLRMNVETYLSAQEFLDSYDPARPGCLVLDVRMPGISGLELQEKLRKRNISIPVIIMTGYGEVAVAVEAMKKGAMMFVEKPISDQVLLDQIQKAIAKDARIRQEQAAQKTITSRLALLTSREHQVMGLVIAGKLNKVIARELGVSQKTVEFHRSNIMKKMKVDSLAELVRLVIESGRIDIPPLVPHKNIVS
ncbi:MAG: response regulator transcription factor [Desulfobacteraceae bacterium]|nr:response regulator transcription factor [Desulfobacteraceae bacterium]